MTRALIIYESKFGNTEQVARELAKGLEEVGVETHLTKPKGMKLDEVTSFDVILFGCPVHMMGPTRGIKKTIDKVGKTGVSGKLTTAFETYAGDHMGKAVTKMEERIAKKMPGLDLVKPGFSALVEGFKGPVATEDLSRAVEFGKMLGNRLQG